MFKAIFLSALMSIPALSFAERSNSGGSLLTNTVEVTGFGQIKYRPPVVESKDFPIVLFHGVYGGASHRTWRELLPLLDKAGKAVYVMDLPGAGNSDKPKKRYTIDDLDQFVERFLDEVVKARATVVTESLAGTAGLKVASLRPDLVRRLVLINPTGVNSLNAPPTEREQRLFDRLFNNETALDSFYQNLLVDNSLQFFLRFGFFNDSLVDEYLLNDYRWARSNPEQKWITLSFVSGQIYRSFEESSRNVFVPTLVLFGAEYEAFADTPPSTAADFERIRPDFEYVEIENSGSVAQREKPEAVAKEILTFVVVD